MKTSQAPKAKYPLSALCPSSWLCRRSKAQLEIEAIQAKLKTMEDEKSEAKAKAKQILPTSLKRKLDEATH